MTAAAAERIEPVVIRHRSDREICATWGAVVVRICDGNRTEIADLERVDVLFDELLAKHESIGMLLVFTHDTPLPTLPTQRYAARSLERLRGRVLLAIATVGLGFWASTFTSAVDAILRAVDGKIAIETTAEKAVERLAGELIGIDPVELLRVYRELSAELGRRG